MAQRFKGYRIAVVIVMGKIFISTFSFCVCVCFSISGIKREIKGEAAPNLPLIPGPQFGTCSEGLAQVLLIVQQFD